MFRGASTNISKNGSPADSWILRAFSRSWGKKITGKNTRRGFFNKFLHHKTLCALVFHSLKITPWFMLCRGDRKLVLQRKSRNFALGSTALPRTAREHSSKAPLLVWAHFILRMCSGHRAADSWLTEVWNKKSDTLPRWFQHVNTGPQAVATNCCSL